MTPAECERVAEEIAAQGFGTSEGFLDSDHVARLRLEALELWNGGAFRQAGVGAGTARQLRPEVRRDLVSWLDPAALTEAQRELWESIELLRVALNRRLMLGLFELEAHLTVYPPGAFYRRHLDQFRGATHRLVSCLVYLNEGWRAEDGGALRLHLSAPGQPAPFDVLPAGGTLVSFLSAEVWHEVLPATRPRLSVAGWLRRRP